MKYNVVVATHHKTGTVWMDGVFKAIARDLGVGLGFFGGNYMYWAVDLLPDANGSPNRTISGTRCG